MNEKQLLKQEHLNWLLEQIIEDLLIQRAQRAVKRVERRLKLVDKMLEVN